MQGPIYLDCLPHHLQLMYVHLAAALQTECNYLVAAIYRENYMTHYMLGKNPVEYTMPPHHRRENGQNRGKVALVHAMRAYAVVDV
jgi:hypothetical protein